MSTSIKISVNNCPSVVGLLSVEQDWIDVSTMTATKPDLRWTMHDTNGHFHAYTDDGELPTLELRSRDVEDDSDDASIPDDEETDDDRSEFDNDNWIESHYACWICGEEVGPKQVADNPNKQIPGRQSWRAELIGSFDLGTHVSVVAETESATFFGVGQVYGIMPTRKGDTISIWGLGELGRRTKPKALSAARSLESVPEEG